MTWREGPRRWPAHADGAPLLRDAVFDARRRYRYWLGRRWAPDGPVVGFVLLNPSTAGARRDDPTVRRCVALARRWGFAALEVANIFALRATDPARLRTARDPVGRDNEAWLLRVAGRVDRLVVGWGNHGALGGRGSAVARLLAPVIALWCLGCTASGEPRHPLRCRGDAPLVPFSPRPSRQAAR